jgi:hypothetical protein
MASDTPLPPADSAGLIGTPHSMLVSDTKFHYGVPSKMTAEVPAKDVKMRPRTEF